MIEQTTLADFLLARIAEDEADVFNKHDIAYHDTHHGDCGCDYPSRVMREARAKRGLVALASRCEREGHDNAAAWLRDALQGVASVYADHPDYREDWQ